MQILHPFAGSIQQYGEAIFDPDRYRPDHCPQCEAQQPLAGHGFYQRTLVDVAFDGVIRVRRYLCRLCKRTVSLLPAFALNRELAIQGIMARIQKCGGKCPDNAGSIGRAICSPLMSATLGRHLEVHMSDYPSHELWLAELKNHLETEQYAATTMARCMNAAGHFLADLAQQHIELDSACPKHVEHYLQLVRRKYRRRHGHSPGYKSWRCLQTDGIHMLLRLVHGQWPPVPGAVTPAEILQKEVCEEYSGWMTGLCGRSPGPVSGRCGEARRFLEWLGECATRETLATLALVDVDDYMKDRAHLLCRSSLRRAASDIRCFLRWLHMTERTVHDLSSTVIAPRVYAFEGIPSAVEAEDVKKIMAVTQKDCTPKGIRDYAILMLLSTYGVRAGEITMLRLDDVDWRKETIRIRHNKTGATSYLPLLPEVGEAILQYLQKSRPKTAFREVFIRCCAPYRPFKGGSNLGRLVRRWFEDAGANTKGRRGPHAFRHARAVSMLRAAVPLKEIGDLLGHRSTDSTSVYLKLATEDLRAVAMEIPTEVKG